MILIWNLKTIDMVAEDRLGLVTDDDDDDLDTVEDENIFYEPNTSIQHQASHGLLYMASVRWIETQLWNIGIWRIVVFQCCHGWAHIWIWCWSDSGGQKSGGSGDESQVQPGRVISKFNALGSGLLVLGQRQDDGQSRQESHNSNHLPRVSRWSTSHEYGGLL